MSEPEQKVIPDVANVESVKVLIRLLRSKDALAHTLELTVEPGLVPEFLEFVSDPSRRLRDYASEEAIERAHAQQLADSDRELRRLRERLRVEESLVVSLRTERDRLRAEWERLEEGMTTLIETPLLDQDFLAVAFEVRREARRVLGRPEPEPMPDLATLTPATQSDLSKLDERLAALEARLGIKPPTITPDVADLRWSTSKFKVQGGAIVNTLTGHVVELGPDAVLLNEDGTPTDLYVTSFEPLKIERLGPVQDSLSADIEGESP